MDQIVQDNNLIAEYIKACRDELKYGCTFATLSADPSIGVRIRFHSPQTAAALWDGEKCRIDCGFAIIDTMPSNESMLSWEPSLINLYTDDAVWVISKVDSSRWAAVAHPHKMGRPLMEALVWNATSNKPFGRSRIKEPIRRLIQGYVRTIANATIGLEFSTTPQKYLLGTEDNAEWEGKKATLASFLNITEGENGSKPSVGQFAQQSMTPFVEQMRMFASQFGGETGLTLDDLGFPSDNPSSAEAIKSAHENLRLKAKKAQQTFGTGYLNTGYLAACLRDNYPYERAAFYLTKPMWKPLFEPDMATFSTLGDGIIKINQAIPGAIDKQIVKDLTGLDIQIEDVRDIDQIEEGGAFD
jgi:hypothetical protein